MSPETYAAARAYYYATYWTPGEPAWENATPTIRRECYGHVGE